MVLHIRNGRRYCHHDDESRPRCGRAQDYISSLATLSISPNPKVESEAVLVIG